MKKVLEVVSDNHGNEKTRVAAYCRVSTGKNEQKNSVQTQQAYFENKYKHSSDIVFVGVYTDIASGTSMDSREGFQKLIEDCRAGRIDRVETKSISRFARNIQDCLYTLRELKRIGVTVLFEDNGIDTERISDEIIIAVMDGLAQEESASISRNTKWAISSRMANGTLGIARVPYGFVKINGQLVIDEERAEVVRRIYEEYLSGLGAKKIAAGLNRDMIPSPTGGVWNNITVFKILKQEKYIGDIRWQKTYSEFMGKKYQINRGQRNSYYIRDCLPAIISRDDFVIAQRLRETNTRHPKNIVNSSFRGKTRCVCGRSYCLRSGNKMIWECTGRYDLVRPCASKSFSDAEYQRVWRRMCRKFQQYADEIILPCIELLALLENVSTDNQLSDIYMQLDELTNRRFALCSLYYDGCITYERLIKLRNEIDHETDALERKAAYLQNMSNDAISELDRLHKHIISAPDNELPELILMSAVSDGTMIQFELLGGIKVKENLT